MSLFEVKNLTKIFGGGLLSQDNTVALDDFNFKEYENTCYLMIQDSDY